MELAALQDPWGRRIHVVGNAAVDAKEACMYSWQNKKCSVLC